ncbi:predicted protein [Streptomyces sp. SPB78]|nr:predicted protein [Streptomyces sp. SPB78]
MAARRTSSADAGPTSRARRVVTRRPRRDVAWGHDARGAGRGGDVRGRRRRRTDDDGRGDSDTTERRRQDDAVVRRGDGAVRVPHASGARDAGPGATCGSARRVAETTPHTSRRASPATRRRVRRPRLGPRAARRVCRVTSATRRRAADDVARTAYRPLRSVVALR